MLRRLLHRKIDTLEERGLAMVHRVILQLDTEKLGAELSSEFGREEELVKRVDRVVAQFRKKHPYK
jgi:hypothetical protein